MKECYEKSIEENKEYGYIHGSKGTITDIISGSDNEISGDKVTEASEKLIEGESVEYFVHTHHLIGEYNGLNSNSIIASESDISFAENEPNKMHIILGYRYVRTNNASGSVDVTNNNGTNIQYVSFYNNSTKSNSYFRIDGRDKKITFDDFSKAINKMNGNDK